MEFKILGPLEVTEQGRSLPLGGRKPRALLAMLLLRHGRVRSVDELIGGLWGDEAPAGAEHGLQVYVSELRKLLGGGEGVTITRREPGYVMEIPADALDLDRFERLRQRGRAALAANEPADAGASLKEALALWRGAPLADFAFDEFARSEIDRLEGLRLETTEDRIDADLAAGEPVDVSELRGLVEAHPFRERIRAALMLALYRDGRQAEALEESRRARALLADELGVDPGPRLVELETAILAQDPELIPGARDGARAATNDGGSAGRPVAQDRLRPRRDARSGANRRRGDRSGGHVVEYRGRGGDGDADPRAPRRHREPERSRARGHLRSPAGARGRCDARGPRRERDRGGPRRDRRARSGDGRRGPRAGGDPHRRGRHRGWRGTRHRCDSAGPHDRCSRGTWHRGPGCRHLRAGPRRGDG